MDYDRDKVDEMTLALLWLTSFKNADDVRLEGPRLGNDGSTLLKGLPFLIRKAKPNRSS